MAWLNKLSKSSFRMTFIMLVLSITIHGMLIATNTTRPSVTHAFASIADGSLSTLLQEEHKLGESSVTANQSSKPVLQEFSVPSGSRPHDVAPASNVTVWYTAQGSGELGRLNPSTNETHHIPLGQGSAPHGVIVGPDGAPWITDGGLNAIVRVDQKLRKSRYSLFPKMLVTLTSTQPHLIIMEPCGLPDKVEFMVDWIPL